MDLYPIGQSTPIQKFRYTLDPGKNYKCSITFLHNGQLVLCGSPTGNVGIWDASSGQHQQSLEHHGQWDPISSNQDALIII
jgi:hypothetical protein